MAPLTHRERVLLTLNHQEPDRVPIDLGGTSLTQIHPDVYGEMLHRLGLQEDKDASSTKAALSMLIAPGEKLLEHLGADFRQVELRVPRFSEQGETFVRQYVDEWGVTWSRADAASEMMDSAGPFQYQEPSSADLERYPWPDPADPIRYAGLKEEAERIRRDTDYALVCEIPYGVLREAQRMRGFSQFLEDLAVNPALAESIMEKTLAVVTAVVERALDEVGPVDVVLWKEDLGFQDRGYMRPATYQRLVKPYHRRLVEVIKKKSDAKILLHSDGSIREYLSDFIDIGVDAINPVQVSCKGMDPLELKQNFGRDLSFWGAIDTQQLLPFGSPEQVRDNVRQCIVDLAPAGGYILASCHNIQRDVPAENALAMFDAAAEYGKYPIR
jgi:uroporphyrinogen decarboxylase